MQGKTVVITGATSGIGEVAADRLAAKGFRIVFIARDRARGEVTLKHLNAIAPGAAHAAHYADLSRLSEMKRVARDIAAAEPKIDVLVNNAGAIHLSREVTEDGLEKTFSTNHMSYFVLTNALLPQLKAAGGARIVSTASDAHKGQKLNFDDLQMEKQYSTFGAYGRSKLSNILFTRELARRLAGTGVTANCLHPGFVNTRFGDNNGGIARFLGHLVKNFGLTPEQGAQTIIYLASSPEVETVSGKYFYKSAVATPTKEAQNDADAKRLWEISEKIAS
jgi:NAD(P)-dependent dehydrogenase (short-subunit alcohol dehydrogenase family)